MNQRVLTLIEVLIICGALVFILYLGSIFTPAPPTPSPIPTGIPISNTLTPTLPKPNISFTPNALAPAPPTPTFPSRTTPTGLIVFESTRDGNSEIYVMNADGSNPHNLTNNPADDFSPVWSPDGKQIAFFSIRSKWQELYVMNADGSQVRQLTDSFQTGMFYQGPVSWSPDGRQILALRSRMWASHKQNIPDLDVIQIDGSGAKRVIEGFTSWLPPVWLPDSQHLTLFNRDANTSFCTLSIIPLSGPSRAPLPLAPQCFFFVFSPDKTHLAYGSGHVYTLDINNPKPEVLGGTMFADGPIYWSPNGEYIVYLTTSGAYFRAAYADGSGVIPFALLFNRNELSWSPDSQWLAYNNVESDGNSDISIINLFDSDHRIQLTNSGNNYAPVWQPNP
jgi:Tol biopolymer transport system component